MASLQFTQDMLATSFSRSVKLDSLDSPVKESATNAPALRLAEFDVRERSGFMPARPPLNHLPERWQVWEDVIVDAQNPATQLILGADKDITPIQIANNLRWRNSVDAMPVLPIDEFSSDEERRRAHSVLSFMLHFYVHSQPPPPAHLAKSPVIIPEPLAVPLALLSRLLDVPAVHTYADDVLYNWAQVTRNAADLEGTNIPHKFDLKNLKCLITYTGTKDEEHFFLTSARIELRGAEALHLMRLIQADLALPESPEVEERIVGCLYRLKTVIEEITPILVGVRSDCDPNVFYDEIRPWFNGATTGRQWVFSGIPADQQPKELSGPSAGQSALIHSLDVFLGIDRNTHNAFLDRMQLYMPAPHRSFLKALAKSPISIRDYVEASSPRAQEAYNGGVQALKRFRDEHIQVATRYIITPARRRKGDAAGEKGSGGTTLVPFLKGVRDRTAGAAIHPTA